jgi:hypothetical protein
MTNPGFDPLYHCQSLSNVAAIDGGSEPIVCVVSDLDHLIHTASADDAHYRAKRFLTADPHAEVT